MVRIMCAACEEGQHGISAPQPHGEIFLYQTEDGDTSSSRCFQDKALWFSQILIAELFRITVQTVNEHLKNIFAEQELEPQATIRYFPNRSP